MRVTNSPLMVVGTPAHWGDNGLRDRYWGLIWQYEGRPDGIRNDGRWDPIIYLTLDDGADGVGVPWHMRASGNGLPGSEDGDGCSISPPLHDWEKL